MWEDEKIVTNSDEKTTYTSEEVEQMKQDMEANYERWIQKKFWEERNLDKILDEVWKVADDKTRLIDLFEEDETVAKIILDKYYEWKSIEDYKTSIDYKVDITDPKVVERMVEKQANQMAETKLISEKKKEFITKLKMTDEEVTDFEEAFIERTQLKSFKLSNLDKHFEKAFRDVSDNTENLKEMKKQEAIANAQATWNGKGWKQVTSEKETIAKKNSNYNKNFLKERWII